MASPLSARPAAESTAVGSGQVGPAAVSLAPVGLASGGRISVAEYRSRVLALVPAQLAGAESVPVRSAVGRTLAQPLVARLSVPPFENSAMDGYAVRASDIASAPVELVAVGESAAAGGPIPTVEPGTAVRVMTGGRIPPGADTVVPVELTDQPAGAAPLPDRVLITTVVGGGSHIRRAAEDLAAGELVLPAGTVLTPAAIAAAASVGYGIVPVRPRPRVAVVSTGAELAEPGAALAAGQIPDSNSLLLAGLAAASGADVVAVERVGDDPGALAELLGRLPQPDVVLTSGGVSAGAYEPVRQLGAGIEFHAVAMQPGKPQGCGWSGGVRVVAFPGNPVSSFVSFLVFGRPLLDALSGARRRLVRRSAVALQGWRSPPGRQQFVPVVIEPDGVRPSHVRGSGSHLIASLHLADALAVVAADVTSVAAGDVVEIMEI